MKSSIMIIPTPSKIDITGNISFLEVVEIEDEDSKEKNTKDGFREREMVEVGGKNMKENF